MSLFKKLFGSKQKKEASGTGADERGKFMPEIKLPTDEKFTINFKKNGGKFLYCDSLEEIHECFNNILSENNWTKEHICCLDPKLNDLFKKYKFSNSNNCHNATLLLSPCENLVADNGAILISSNQIKESKLNDLPDNFIIFATTSQLVDTIGEGLRGIKNKNKNQIPTNITTIKHFSIQEEKDFLTYGSSSKNLYLLLLEDL
ncbi:LUD domain-containing protein [Galbibacter pacificus]|uniref:LUD domain-containing protein n=1 Tax=Galbibacter pacificus TaxID=2996052 RepID=A0ABT6FM14_9FLAO|nr:LUD domain-containing protein [Galbibacter pacificus]MDG3580831.1 LUD domain-containing protein [Galbibacter pacificus]MDG3584309.1 LUD domain-containing protein [Galbibacter pacificus]